MPYTEVNKIKPRLCLKCRGKFQARYFSRYRCSPLHSIKVAVPWQLRENLIKFGEAAKRVLQATAHEWPENTWGNTVNGQIRHALEKAIPPSEADLQYWTETEAKLEFSRNRRIITPVIIGPIETEWEGRANWLERLRIRKDGKLSMQKPSLPYPGLSYEDVPVLEVCEHFAMEDANGEPWNGLDIDTQQMRSVIPVFLDSLQCRALHEVVNGPRAARGNVLEPGGSVLMANKGANTGAHMDSRGYATYLEIKEGTFEIMWKLFGTSETQVWFLASVSAGVGIYVPPRTIHQVARCEDSIEFTCHIIRDADIPQSMKVLNWLLDHPNDTNEEITSEWAAHSAGLLDYAKAQEHVDVEEIWKLNVDNQEKMKKIKRRKRKRS